MGMVQSTNRISLLKVSENRRFLTHADGAPFFWLGDTAWELFHKLSREEAEHYLAVRAEQQFTVIQAVALAENDGIRTANAYGRTPFRLNDRGEYDPAMPDTGAAEGGADDYDYWKHVDFIVDKAAEFGLYIALLPSWGDKWNIQNGKGPQLFNPENAEAYGEWLGARYGDRDHIIWIMGGDRPIKEPVHIEVMQAMARGLKKGERRRHLMTFHPQGRLSSSKDWHDADWLDFNMLQSGHDFLHLPNYVNVRDDYELSPIKPALDGEPRYEDHPIGFKPENGYFRDRDIREAAYWAVFAGAFGHTYGHHSVWFMNRQPGDYWTMHWKDAIERPGAEQMRFVRRLIESRPFLSRVPGQSLLIEERDGNQHLQATRGDGYAMIYSPDGSPFGVQLGKIGGSVVRAGWYNPRTGEYIPEGSHENRGAGTFNPPEEGTDWVLILDDADKSFPLP